MSEFRYHERLRRGGGALILNQDDEVLLLLRARSARNDQGMWSQPGGQLEQGDSPEKAVEREIREEVGVTVALRRFLTTTAHEDRECQWLAYSYLGDLRGGTIRCCEPQKHDDVRWFPLRGLPERLNQVTRDAVAAYQASRMPPVEPTRLLLFDMDGTLLPGTTANLELARVLGALAFVQDLEARYHDGAIDNHAYADCILALYRRLTPDLIERAFHRAPKLSGLNHLICWAHEQGMRVAVLTTGPEFFARLFAKHLGFDHVVGSHFPLDDGPLALSSCRLVRDGDKPARADALCQTLGLARQRCIAVGDSRSDLALFGAYRNCIALNYTEVLRDRARCYLKTDLALDLIPAVSSMM